MWIELDVCWVNTDNLTHMRIDRDGYNRTYYVEMYDNSGDDEPFESPRFSTYGEAEKWMNKITNHQ